MSELTDTERAVPNHVVNAVAHVLMDAWERAEGKPVTPSYVATFADMARAIAAGPLAAARAEGARDMRTKIETSKRDLSHIIHRFDCEWTDECAGPNFNDQRLADQVIAALLADGGEPQ